MSADAATAMVEIGMPRLSDSMEEATVLQWLKQPGDVVRKGEPIVEVETDKATIVYEAELDGVLEEIVVDEGETAALGAVIARVRVEGAGPAAAQAPPAPAQPAPAAPAPAPARCRRGYACSRCPSVDTCRSPPCDTRRAPACGGARCLARGRRRHRPRRPDRSLRRPGGCRKRSLLGCAAARRARGRGGDRAHVDPAHDRPAHVAVPDRDPGLHARGGDRHGVRGTDARRSSRIGPRAAPVVQRSRRAGGRARTPRVPGPERVVRRTARCAATRGSTSASPSRPTTRSSCRRSSTQTRSRCSSSPPSRAVSPRRFGPVDRSGRPCRRHVHRLEPRHVRRAPFQRGHQPSAGGDPRGRRGGAATGGGPTAASSRGG